MFRLCGKDSYRYRNNQFGFTFEFIRSKESINDSTNDSTNDSINDPTNDSINDPTGGGLTDNESSVLKLLGRDQRYSKSDLAKKTGKSTATIQRIISKLTDKGLIKRIGSNKTGYRTML